MEQLSYGYILLIGITIGYAIVALDLARMGNFPLSLVFGAYSVANVGLLWAMK